jgi:hypothetical protein
VRCQFELVFEVVILILQRLGLLDDFLSLYFVLLLANFIIESILFEGEGADVSDQILELTLLQLYFLFELQLCVVQFLIE